MLILHFAHSILISMVIYKMKIWEFWGFWILNLSLWSSFSTYRLLHECGSSKVKASCTKKMIVLKLEITLLFWRGKIIIRNLDIIIRGLTNFGHRGEGGPKTAQNSDIINGCPLMIKV